MSNGSFSRIFVLYANYALPFCFGFLEGRADENKRFFTDSFPPKNIEPCPLLFTMFTKSVTITLRRLIYGQ